ncbi:MAG: GAF domain-containing protein [Leptolyngbyaceae cyanobacterium MO_188.B28]|nr:GAF domain-containing protein [Leptolyngbyaceae cyanobacterium MO_188.B28]
MSYDSPNWLRRLAGQISQGQDLQAIFKTTVEDLCSFLEIDRVKICQFQPDGRGKVMAEAIHDNRLPSILASQFPTSDLSPYSQDLLVQSPGGAMINLKTNTICKMPSSNEDLSSFLVEKTTYLPVDSYSAQSLTKMGVKFSIVIPILYNETAWGILIAHHSETHFVSIRKFEVLRMVVDQLTVAVAQQTLRTQTQTKVEQEAVFNQIVNRLQASPNPEFQPALESVVAVLQGSGGRLCMSNPTQALPDGSVKNFAACLATSSQEVKVYACGSQPAIPSMTHSTLMEQYSLWKDHYQSGYYQVWPIENLFQTSELQPLFDAFRPTQICSLLMIPLTYRQQLLGYLSVFRNSAASTTPQMGLVASEQAIQGQVWTNLELAQRLGQQFAVAIHEYELSQQLHNSNTHLNTELQQQTIQLQQVAQQQQGLSELLVKIKAAIDPETIFQTTTKELCHLLKAERVAVYRFNADWGGEFVHDFEYVVSAWQ